LNLLVTGKGTSGSWAIRGVQLGTAIGATVQANALDVAAFDTVVLVKRPPGDLVERVHRAGVRLVWDIVDAWPQPIGNGWDRDMCLRWLRGKVEEIRPAAIVAATRAMAADCEEFGVPVITLPHHAWEGQGTCSIAAQVRRVGYQGGVQYLGRWRQALDEECRRRGWIFDPQPLSVGSLDIVVALREAQGYAPRHWKSNVKLANAQGCGTPFVGNREAGYLETASGAECWADTESELAVALDALTPQESRARVSAHLKWAAPRLESVAHTYRAWLEKLDA
jgi:hypothetical protein